MTIQLHSWDQGKNIQSLGINKGKNLTGMNLECLKLKKKSSIGSTGWKELDQINMEQML